jgi:hypothetical protein
MASQEGMSYQFVVHVYEAITKQIQQFDVKVSVLLSWNGVKKKKRWLWWAKIEKEKNR